MQSPWNTRNTATALVGWYTRHGVCVAGASGEPQAGFVIPPDTAIHTAIMADANKHSCSLQVSTNNDTNVRGVMLFAEQVH